MYRWAKALPIVNMVVLPIAIVLSTFIVAMISLLAIWSTNYILPSASLYICIGLDAIVLIFCFIYIFIRNQYIVISVSYLVCWTLNVLLAYIIPEDKIISIMTSYIQFLSFLLFVVTTVNLIVMLLTRRSEE